MPGKGERWWDALKRYYLLGDVATMRTLSGPTRPPGRYTVPGTARTKGERPWSRASTTSAWSTPGSTGYELFREKVELLEKPFQRAYPLKGELQEVVLDYGRKA